MPTAVAHSTSRCGWSVRKRPNKASMRRRADTMKFTLGVAMSPLDQLHGLAQTAEECGFSSIALPDSLFFMETAAEKYPYTPDGSRMWNADTPWVDPLIAAASMAAVTKRIRFYTNVLKLG